MDKTNCTKGPVYEYRGEVREEDPVSGRTIATISDRLRDDEIEPNASLIAEAFNVLHQRGYTPLELVEHKGLLIAALKDLMESFACRCGDMENPEWTRSYDYAERLVQACERGDEMPVPKTP